MRQINNLLLVLLVLLLSACAVTHQGAAGKSGMAVLQFRGDCEGVSFKIDEHAKIAIVGLCEETQFTVTPGRHVVRVYRDDAIIVEKILQFSADMTNEVSLP